MGQLDFRWAVAEAPCAAISGKTVVVVSLCAKAGVFAKVGCACESTAIGMAHADARSGMAGGTFVPTPAALVRRWCEGPPAGGELSDAL